MIPHNQIADYSDIIYDHGVEQVPVKFIVEVCDSTYFDHVSRGHDFRGLDYINDLTDYMERNGFVGCGQLEYHLNGVLTYQDGYHRLAAATRLGLECVPVRLVEVKWSPSKEGVECGVVFDGLVKFFGLFGKNLMSENHVVDSFGSV